MSLTIVFRVVWVYHERVDADKLISKLCFLMSFSSQHHSNVIASIASENLSQVRKKVCKSRSFICRVNPKFLRSSSHLSCDTVFAVIVSFLNESAHGFNNICKEG